MKIVVENRFKHFKAFCDKFEKDYSRFLEYRFLKAYPISINSMPVSYDGSQILKCTVNFNFSRYLSKTGYIVPDNNLVAFNDNFANMDYVNSANTVINTSGQVVGGTINSDGLVLTTQQ